MATANTAETYTLALGDSDKQKRWAGTVHSTGSGEHVRDLQLKLRAVGCLNGKADGDFGKQTLLALKRFQWHLQKIRRRLNASGQAVVHEGVFPTPTGIFDGTTRLALADFVGGEFTCAGPLVRIAFHRLSRFRPNVGFRLLVPTVSCMVVDREFARTLSEMNVKAAQEGLYIYVNQAFRRVDQAVSGAKVRPATGSAHKLGRAIDMQLGSAKAAQPADEILSAARDTPIGRFRDHMIALGCRYGGYFKGKENVDTPHFDRQIFALEEWSFRCYFAQRQLTQGPGTHATRVPPL